MGKDLLLAAMYKRNRVLFIHMPVLMRWKEDNSIAHTSTCTLIAAETVALKIYSIEIK